MPPVNITMQQKDKWIPALHAAEMAILIRDKKRHWALSMKDKNIYTALLQCNTTMQPQ